MNACTARLQLVPVTLTEANAFVGQEHRAEAPDPGQLELFGGVA